MTQLAVNLNLCDAVEKFIRGRRNFDGCGHEKKHLFDCTSPFRDTESMRISPITNSTYDFLDYKPTPAHLFLKDASLDSFEDYVARMFRKEDEWNDWCYFKIFKKLLPPVYNNLVQLVKEGSFKRVKPSSDYKLPICMIPIMEYLTLEKFSQAYKVKTACVSLEKTKIRLKLNTFFMALKRLLGCSESDSDNESDIIDLLVKYGVLPSRNFSLISTQKEVTVACSLFKKSGLEEQLGKALVAFESQCVLVKPLHAFGNQNLHQTLIYLFQTHPLYKEYRQNLVIQTEIEGDGKGRLAHARPNNKRKYTDNARDQSLLPKKWRSNVELNNTKRNMEDIVSIHDNEQNHIFQKDIDHLCTTSSSDTQSKTDTVKEAVNEDTSHPCTISSSDAPIKTDILKEAMDLCGIPALLIPLTSDTTITFWHSLEM